jgi:hypothetical protein
MRFYDCITALFAFTQSPIGTYCGSKTVFGETVNGVVRFKSPELLDFVISGDFDINCFDEYYSVDGSNIVLRDIGLEGDCTHDALTDNKITLNSIAYDAVSNKLDVSVKYSIAKLDIELTPCDGIA